MATITRTISTKTNGNGHSEILLRVNAKRGNQIRIKSGLYISPARFKDGNILIPRKGAKEIAEVRETETRLTELEQFVMALCEKSQGEISKEELLLEIDKRDHPEKYAESLESPAKDFFGCYEEFLKERDLAQGTAKQHWVLFRTLHRYEAFKRLEGESDFSITFDGLTPDFLKEFKEYMTNEDEAYNKHPQIFAVYPANVCAKRKTPKPHTRSHNTLHATFTRLRTFFHWCQVKEYITLNPFDKFSLGSEKYGTPYYLTIAERDTIAKFDFGNNRPLSIQRDIFIFQCLIGCRVSDLMGMTQDNIIEGGVEYIAQKTKGEDPKVIRVPLHPMAKAIIERYRPFMTDNRLFPFIAPQKYNEALKKIFALCGITRSVTILNPNTGQEEKRPLNEVASSHIARRTFIGNLYRKVKDPNLIGKLSGHVEGSKAFARYRDIDEEVMRDTISLLSE